MKKISDYHCPAFSIRSFFRCYIAKILWRRSNLQQSRGRKLNEPGNVSNVEGSIGSFDCEPLVRNQFSIRKLFCSYRKRNLKKNKRSPSTVLSSKEPISISTTIIYRSIADNLKIPQRSIQIRCFLANKKKRFFWLNVPRKLLDKMMKILFFKEPISISMTII